MAPHRSPGEGVSAQGPGLGPARGMGVTPLATHPTGMLAGWLPGLSAMKAATPAGPTPGESCTTQQCSC